MDDKQDYLFSRQSSQKQRRSTTFVGRASFRLTNTFNRSTVYLNSQSHRNDHFVIPLPEMSEPTSATVETVDTEFSADESSRRKKNTLKIRRKKIKTSNQVLFSVLRFSLPVIWNMGGRKDLILFIVFTILEKVFTNLSPFALKFTIDNVTSDSHPLVIGSLVISDFYTLATLFALTIFLSQLFDSLTNYERLKAVQVARPLILQISLEHLSWMKMEFFEDLNTQALTNLLESGLNAFSDITATMLYFISPLSTFVITFVIFASIFEWQIIVLCVISVAIYMQIMLALMFNKVNSYNYKSARFDEYSGKLTEYLDKIELARLFGAEEHEIKQVYDTRIAYENAIQRDSYVTGKIQAIGALVLIIFLGAFMYVTRYYIQNSSQSIGDFTVILSQLSLLYTPMKTMVIDVLHLKQSREDAYCLFQLLLNTNKECPQYEIKRLEYEPVQIVDQQTGQAKTVYKKNYSRLSKNTFITSGEVEFENVTMEAKDYFNFIYGRIHSKRKIQILSNISFKLESGHSIGIVGPSGSGKSTIWKVIARIYELSAGVIKIGGVDISLIDREELRKRITIVPQEVQSIRQNLKYNIAYGGLGDSIDIKDNYAQLQEAVSKSRFIQKLKERKDFNTHKVVKRVRITRKQNRTKGRRQNRPKRRYIRREEEVPLADQQSPLWKFKLGSNVKRLSPGQISVLGVARALMKRDALVYVFDDLRTDPNYLNGLINILKIENPKAIFLVLSQSVLQIKECDEVLVIDKGELAEIGTHQQLFQNQGPYYKMWLHQMKLSQLEEDTQGARINGSFDSKERYESGSKMDTCFVNPIEFLMSMRQARMTRVGRTRESQDTLLDQPQEQVVEEAEEDHHAEES